MIDFTIYALFFVLVIFAYFSVKQDFAERKVSNYLTGSLFVISFSYFVYSSSKLLWIDFMIIFFSFLIAFFVYHKKIWGAADGKIFLGIMLLLTSYSHSETFLRWCINLMFFYGIVLIVLSIIGTNKKTKIKTLKSLDYLDSSLVILCVFIIIDIILMFYFVDNSNVTSLIMFFLVLMAFLYKVKKYLIKNFKKMFDDVKLMLLAILFMWNFLYGGMFIFILQFILVMCIKTMISFVSALSGKLKNLDDTQYNSPFSLYLFFTAIFTLLTNKSFVEILVLFFY